MLNHEQMTLNYRDASSDTDMRDACLKDRERFFVKGAWWSGSHGKQFKNKPKPEFNKLWKSINRLVGTINDMELNAIIVSNSDDATDESADLLQKRWRNDFQSSDGIEASEVATMEAAIGGFGCTKLVAKYEDDENPDPEKQYLCSEIVWDACQSVYFDAGAIRKDKSDARYGWHLIRANREKIEEEYGVNIVSFMNPTSYWRSSNLDLNSQRDIYLAHYYEVVEKKLTTYDFSLMNGLKITAGDGIKDEEGNSYTREDLREIRDIYGEEFGEVKHHIETGEAKFIPAEAPTTKRTVKYVEYALADGEKYLTKPQRMPFKRVPLFPRYGYYAVIQGQEYYCGEVRKQEDHEMFHNYFASSMMEIMAAPQVSKPEYTPGQIAKHAGQRARADIDNVPFLMSDPLLDKDGNIAHLGPIAMSQPPMIGTGLATAGQFLEQNLQQAGGMGQASVPSNASGEAIQNVNERQDDAFLPIVKNTLHSIKAQCEAWIPAAQALYFTNQRRIRVLETDGTYSQVTTLEMTQDPDGNYGPYGNNAKGKFTVQVEQGEAYKDTVETTIESNMMLMQAVGTDTAAGQIIAYKNMELLNKTDDPAIQAIAKYERLNIIIAKGIPYEPQNEEEAQYIQMKMQQMQQQAQSQQDPMTIAAQAEMLKAQEKSKENNIKEFSEVTERIKVLGDLELKNIDLNRKSAETQIKAVGSLGSMANI